MRASIVALAFAALVAATPSPGGITSAVAPAQSPPPGCSPNYDGTFVISPTNLTASKKRGLDERNTQLGIKLVNGVLTDPQGRTGYVASNQQFQFDDPPQAGAIWTAGFSVCQNGSLALGNTAVWYRCLSGTFYNLYFKSIGGQCIPSFLDASPLSGGGPGPVPASLSTEVFTTSTASGNSSSSSAAASSSSAAANNSSTVTTTKSGGTGTATGIGHTTAVVTQTGSGASSASSASASASASASSSSSSGGAAVATGYKGEMFGLAAGLLAFAVL